MGIAIPLNLLIWLVKSSFVGSELGNFTPIPKKEDDTKTTRKNLGYPQKLVVYYHCPYESFHFFAKLYGFFHHYPTYHIVCYPCHRRSPSDIPHHPHFCWLPCGSLHFVWWFSSYKPPFCSGIFHNGRVFFNIHILTSHEYSWVVLLDVISDSIVIPYPIKITFIDTIEIHRYSIHVPKKNPWSSHIIMDFI